MNPQRNGSISSDVSDASTVVDVEATNAKSEDVGRGRPAVFKAAWREVVFVISLLTSLSMAVSSSPNAYSRSLVDKSPF